MSLQYENYLANHCSCDRSDDVCMCLSFEDFCIEHIIELKDAWGQLIYETECGDMRHA